MKKIVFKIIIFISNKKQQQKMSTTSEIVNSVFDWRSVGGIIMSYIETPKEEYKKVYDLQIQALKKKLKNDGIMDRNNRFCTNFSYIMNNYIGYEDDEIDKLVDILIKKFEQHEMYPDYKVWLRDNHRDEYRVRDYYYRKGYGGVLDRRDKREPRYLFHFFELCHKLNLSDDLFTLRFKLLCDYNKFRCYLKKQRTDSEWKIQNKCLQDIEDKVISKFHKLIIDEMYLDGTMKDSFINDKKTDDEEMIDYCLKYFYKNKNLK